MNIVLRPLGYRINQQPLQGTELELRYQCSLTCYSQDEAHVRALLLQALGLSQMQLIPNPAQLPPIPHWCIAAH